MTRFFIALASIAMTAAPLWAVDSIRPEARARRAATTPETIGLDNPVFLGRMTVTASPLPPTAG
ncbi:hypothetical protein PX699_14035 [Sphingobium sp. H39-3-25]|uniref:hypothetical protein n=1 Tax=Sphingobium arseniciresistens TaxID=3030834 RepID=UPI0023B9FD89|nr:hypothetical protein [Sphingobium arseniciresistens]